MYRIDLEEIAKEQVRELPEHLVSEFASLITVLELQPWSGPSFDERHPGGNIRRHLLGVDGECAVVYLILEDQRLVHILRVLWV